MPAIGFGTYPLKDELLSLVPTAIENGCRLIDTAWKYQNESQIGTAIRSINCVDLFVDSKINIKQLYPYRWLHKLRLIVPPLHSVESLYAGSCKRLGLDKLNLYLMHYPYPTYRKIWKEMVSLYERGKVDAIGVCSFSKNHIQNIITDTNVAPMVNQIEMHPYNTNKEILQFCNEKNIRVMAFSPFGGGLITQRLFEDEVLTKIAKEYNKSVSQVILRWLIQLGVVPVFKTSKKSRIKENLDVFDFELTSSQMGLIDSLNKNEAVLLKQHGSQRHRQK